MVIILSGPQGCGKTTNAPAIAKHYGVKYVIEDGELPEGSRISDALFLTNNESLTANNFRKLYNTAQDEYTMRLTVGDVKKVLSHLKWRRG